MFKSPVDSDDVAARGNQARREEVPETVQCDPVDACCLMRSFGIAVLSVFGPRVAFPAWIALVSAVAFIRHQELDSARQVLRSQS